MIATLTVTILVVELATCILYLAPLSASMRRTLVKTVEQSGVTATLSPYVKFSPAVAASAFVYALLEVTRAQSKLEAASDGACAQRHNICSNAILINQGIFQSLDRLFFSPIPVLMQLL
jgi:hypothetical protein